MSILGGCCRVAPGEMVVFGVAGLGSSQLKRGLEMDHHPKQLWPLKEGPSTVRVVGGPLGSWGAADHSVLGLLGFLDICFFIWGLGGFFTTG